MLLHFSFIIFCCFFIFFENDRVSYLILFIKVLKCLRQLFGAKKVVAQFFPNFFVVSLFFLENDCVSYYLIYKSS